MDGSLELHSMFTSFSVEAERKKDKRILTAFNRERAEWIIERENVQASLTWQDQMSPEMTTEFNSMFLHLTQCPFIAFVLTSWSSWLFHYERFLRRSASGWWDYLWSHRAWWSRCRAATFCRCDEWRLESRMMIDSHTSVSDHAIAVGAEIPLRISTF